MTTVLIQTLASVASAFGFGIIFNIKGNKLIFAAIGGGIGWFVYGLGLYLGLSEISALFISSICFSVYSEICARVLKTPVTTLVICCLIPLVPGAGMYYTMYEAITGSVTGSLEIGLQTLSNSGTLALGVILVSTITRLINVAKSRRENRLN